MLGAPWPTPGTRRHLEPDPRKTELTCRNPGHAPIVGEGSQKREGQKPSAGFKRRLLYPPPGGAPAARGDIQGLRVSSSRLQPRLVVSSRALVGAA